MTIENHLDVIMTNTRQDKDVNNDRMNQKQKMHQQNLYENLKILYKNIKKNDFENKKDESQR